MIRNSSFTKLLWGLMGFYLLNISVDTTDFYPENIPEDLTINDQESIVEIVVEKILGYEDAFEEYDDNDKEDHNKKSSVKIDLINRCVADGKHSQAHPVIIKQNFPNLSAFLISGFQKRFTPPPQI